jgi:hypothetical protein
VGKGKVSACEGESMCKGEKTGRGEERESRGKERRDLCVFVCVREIDKECNIDRERR